MNKVTTTQRIKELSIQKYGRVGIAADDDCVEFLNLCCQNASRMAELLDAIDIIVSDHLVGETYPDPSYQRFEAWQRAFSKFQRGEQ